jgi:hypothetical protein
MDHSICYLKALKVIKNREGMLFPAGSNFNFKARFKNVSNCLNNNIYLYLETSGGQSSNLYLYVGHFLNISVN